MAKFAEGRFAEISLPNILHHQGLCTPSCAPPGEERASGLSHCSSIISGNPSGIHRVLVLVRSAIASVCASEKAKLIVGR
jgi:hypothetical protein